MLDEELEALPEKSREPLGLSVEGKAYSEAANQLGWSDGTVCGRMARARDLLKRRLTHRGIAVSAATLTATSIESATAPAAVVASVAGMTRAFLLSQSMGNTASTTAIVLARGLLQTMALSKLKLATVGIGLLCVCAATRAGFHNRLAKREKCPGRRGERNRKKLRSSLTRTPPPFQRSREGSGRSSHVAKGFLWRSLASRRLARMGSTQFRHALAELAFADDGKSLISAAPITPSFSGS